MRTAAKPSNLALLARPARIPGFQAGVSVYFDKLTPAGLARIGETIIAGHAVYQTSEIEWLSEVVFVRHASEGGDHSVNTTGFYAQLSKQFGAWRPYVRYQYVNVPTDDPVFADVGRQRGPSLGVRYDVNDSVALKLQYDRTEREVPGRLQQICGPGVVHVLSLVCRRDTRETPS